MLDKIMDLIAFFILQSLTLSTFGLILANGA